MLIPLYSVTNSSTSMSSFGHPTSLSKPTQPAIVSNPLVCYPTPSTLDTPSCSHLTSTSPTSSSSPPTLLDVQNFDLKIISSASSTMASLASDVIMTPPMPSISMLKHKAYPVPESTSSTPTSTKQPSKCKS